VQVLKRLFGYVRSYWKPLVVTGALWLLHTGLNLLPPLFQREIVDQVIGGRDLSRLGVMIATLIGVYAVCWASASFSIYGCASTPTCNDCPSPSSNAPPPEN
jgi:ABC-type multidrug transport system fused ATPase/permease subunit